MSESRAWDADAGTRSRTRAVLMSISRDRMWYFVFSIPWTIVGSLLTLGLFPVLDAARRFDRWRRLEWMQYGETMAWIADRTGDLDARALADEAAAASGDPSPRIDARLAALAGLLILAWAAWQGGVRGLLLCAFWPASLEPAAIAFTLVMSMGWAGQYLGLARHRGWIERWLASASDVLASHDKRPIRNAAPPTPWPWIVVGIVIGIGGPVWLGASVVVLALRNRYIRSTRLARMGLAERMLEWMDKSGLPMEFDVEALEPDEIAARLN